MIERDVGNVRSEQSKNAYMNVASIMKRNKQTKKKLDYIPALKKVSS